MSDLAVTGTRLSTILIVRNDGTSEWKKDDAYCLQKGEIGVEYLHTYDEETEQWVDTGKIIVRVGVDGKTPWARCPQVEKVFEDNIKLNYDFGRHKTVNGYVDAGGKNMTVSEWLKSCLQNILSPSIEQPTYTLSTDTITTNSGTYEIGSKVTKIKWNGSATTGSYQYGSKDDDGNVYTKADGTGCTKSFEITYSGDGSASGQTEDGTWTIKTPIEIDNDKGIALGTITGTYTWSNSPRTPVNNVGDKDGEAIKTGSITQTATYSVTGYREGFFYGWFTAKTAVEDITGAMIRATLAKTDGTGYKTSKKYASTINAKTGVDTPIDFDVQAGAATLFMAWPADKTGVTSILNTTVNAYMNESFDISNPKTVKIGGCDNAYEVDYKIVTFTPNKAYSDSANLKVTLG